MRMCEAHGLPIAYICITENCNNQQPICVHQDCLHKHCHEIQMNLIPIQSLIEKIQQRKQEHKQKFEQIKGKLQLYFSIVKQGIFSGIEQKQKQCNIIQRIVMQIADLSPEACQSIQNFIALNFDKIQKKHLNSLIKNIRSQVNTKMRQCQLQELDKEIQRKIQNYKKLAQSLDNSYAFQKIFKINLVNYDNMIRTNRFDNQTSSWSFNSGKIDALTIHSSTQVFMMGYIHFGLISISSPQQGISLIIRLYEQDRQLFKIQRKFQAQQVINKEFQILFQAPVAILRDTKYDISSENAGSNFQGKQGNTHKTTVGPFKFSKSTKDNNGTSHTGGQFKGFLYYESFQ